MMEKMELYANHLEELVDDRTRQLAEEQKKTEELLCRMLPPYVLNIESSTVSLHSLNL